MPNIPTIAVKESRADLLEIGPSTGLSGFRLVYVIGKGLYRWRTGDQSGNVPSGNDSDRWIAPSEDTSGASGAWQRDATDVSYIDTFTAGHIDGLELSNGTDAAHDIDIATGVCSMRDGSGNRKLFNLTSGLTKQIDANWAEGTDSGGFPSGDTLSADTHYNVFLIGKDDGTVDAGFDDNANAATLLTDASNYSWFRRVGSVFTDGSSNIIGFTQNGDQFIWNASQADVSNDSSGTLGTFEQVAITCPPNQQAIVAFLSNLSSSTSVFAFLTGSEDNTNTGVEDRVQQIDAGGNGSNDLTVLSEHLVVTNGSSQIKYTMNGTGSWDRVDISTIGWNDDRGRNA